MRKIETCDQIGQENSADSAGATVESVVNDGNGENKEGASKVLSGEEDSNAVLFPRPLVLLGDARTLLRKRKLGPKKLCQLSGSPQMLGNDLGTIAAENRPKP